MVNDVLAAVSAILYMLVKSSNHVIASVGSSCVNELDSTKILGCMLAVPGTCDLWQPKGATPGCTSHAAAAAVPHLGFGLLLHIILLWLSLSYCSQPSFSNKWPSDNVNWQPNDHRRLPSGQRWPPKS
jgi:hypothetical protein